MSDKTIETPFSHWLVLVAAGIIVAAGLLVYLNSFGGPFIFDDPGSISENPSIRQIWDTKKVLSPPAHGQAVQRRPVVNLSLAINYAIGGLDVRGYHVFNLSVHILAALTLFGVVRRTLGSSTVSEHLRRVSTALALVIALIWVVHPLQTEAVTYIIQRTELLAGLFYLLALYCIIRGNGSNKKQWWYITAVITCALGMGSKEAIVSAPVVVLIYDRVFLSRSFKEVFRHRWGLYIALAGTWGITALLIPHGSEGSAVFGQGTASLSYAAGQFEVITNYLRLCFWPWPLILDYGLYEPTSLRQALPYAAFVSLLLLGTVLGLYYRGWAGFLGVWFFAILAPSSSFIPVMGQGSAEKRMYLPLAAVVTMVVVCVYALGRRVLDGHKRAGRVIGYTAAGAVIVILAGLTVRRNYDYRSELEIWQDTLDKRPNNTRAYNNRGLVYWRMGKYDQAISDFDRAVELKPEYAKSYNNRGLAYWSMGKRNQAIRDFDEAIRLNPSSGRAYYNRAEVYREEGNHRKAIRDLDKAIELGLENARVYNNRGVAYSSKGDYDRAISDFEQAIELNPRNTEAYYNRGITYSSKGNYDRAIIDFDQAIKLNNAYANAYYNRGLAYQGKDDLEQATRDYNKAIELDPRNTEAYNNRGITYSSKGNYDRAIIDFDQAIKLNNAYANAYYNRGLAYQGKDDLEQATRDYNKAIELDSRNVKAYNNLAWTLATHEDAQLRDGAEAVRLAERACELTEYKLPYTLDTLAAAYAELGQFDQAIETAQRAAQSAQKAGKRELSESIRNRLKLYQAKRPYRESFSPEGLSAPEPK